MTAPDEETPDARWCTTVAGALHGVSERMGRLAAAIADDWRDPRGQEWAERAALLHRELGRVAAEAAEIGAAITRRATDDALSCAPLHTAGLGQAARSRGPRLGAVEGERTADDPGMRIAQLPEPG